MIKASGTVQYSNTRSALTSALALATGATSPSGGEWDKRFADQQKALTPLSGRADDSEPPADAPINHKLYHLTAALKVMTSRISMHLTEQWRKDIFSQLDDLFDPENWDPDDIRLDLASYNTFLRLLAYEPTLRRASLGVSNAGNLLAGWVDGGRRLTIEFLPRDLIRWILSHQQEKGEIESAAGQNSILRLRAVLAPYQAFSWITNGNKTASGR